MNVLERLQNSANNNHGLMLQPFEARQLAGLIMTLEQRIQWMINLQAAYMNEYGADLYYTLVGDQLVEGEVVDAESSGDTCWGEKEDHDLDEQAREWVQVDGEGQVQEEAGVHAQTSDEEDVSDVPLD